MSKDGQYLLATFCPQYPHFGFAIPRLAPNGCDFFSFLTTDFHKSTLKWKINKYYSLFETRHLFFQFFKILDFYRFSTHVQQRLVGFISESKNLNGLCLFYVSFQVVLSVILSAINSDRIADLPTPSCSARPEATSPPNSILLHQYQQGG